MMQTTSTAIHRPWPSLVGWCPPALWPYGVGAPQTRFACVCPLCLKHIPSWARRPLWFRSRPDGCWATT